MRSFRQQSGHIINCSEGAYIESMVYKNPRRGVPGVAGRKRHTGLTRNLQRRHACNAQILVQDADRRRADHVARPGDRKRRNRQAARQRLEQHEAKGVGPTREHEDVGRRIDLRQFLALPGAEEHRIRIFPLQRHPRRTIADD